MSRKSAQLAIIVAALFVLVIGIVYVSASEAATQGEGVQARPRTNTPTRTRTPTRTPTRTATPIPTNTPTNTPIPSCGLEWRDVPAARPGTALYGIEVVSANDIWAVGLNYEGTTARTLIQHWNGTQWSIVPSPNVGTGSAYLFELSAVSASDIWAIGTRNGNGSTLAIHWDGTQWGIVPTPNPGINENYLVDIKAVSANDVWAVGYFRNGPPYASQMFIVRWNGTSWSQMPGPNTGYFSNVLTSIDVISANDIWAVGYSMQQNAPASQTQTLTIHWDGSSWSVVPSGRFNRLSSVSAVSSNDVWAVGSDDLYSITMHWNGSVWSEVPSPEPGNNSINLSDVVAISSNDVWAVGYYDSLATGGTVPLMIHWDGTQWNQVERDWGTAPDFLTAMDAVSGTDVWAAGYNYTEGVFFVRYSDPCNSGSK